MTVNMASVAQRFPTTSEDVRPHAPIARTLRDALVAGQTAGVAMAIAMMVVSTFLLGQTPFVPIQSIGAFVLGSSALDGMNPIAFVVGFLLHQLGPALAWSLAFGALVAVVRPQRAVVLMYLGLFVGVLAQVVDVYILLPRITTALSLPNYWAEHVHPAVSWLVHLVFGLGLCMFPWNFDPVTRRYA